MVVVSTAELADVAVVRVVVGVVAAVLLAVVVMVALDDEGVTVVVVVASWSNKLRSLCVRLIPTSFMR